MKPNVARLKAKGPSPVNVEVPAVLCAADLRSAATALEDLVEDTYQNTLSACDRLALTEVAGWLRRTAKATDPRDVADWDAVLALREDRETRAANQLVASRYGVSEATIREASFARQNDRSRRRIVR